jgi:integrase
MPGIRGIIEQNLAPAEIGKKLVQKLRPTDLERYYAGAAVSPATLAIHHAILHRALEKAKRDRIVPINVAVGIDRPKPRHHKSDDARQHCWTAGEASTFLETAQARGIQSGAFYALALDSGARKGELCGLTWENLDLETATMHIVRQLLVPGPEPVFGPPKTGRPRSVSLSPTTVALLRTHRQHQRELFMANRPSYRDHRLVFEKEWDDLHRRMDCLGHPLQLNTSASGSTRRSFRRRTCGRLSFTACATRWRRCYCRRACRCTSSASGSGTRR